MDNNNTKSISLTKLIFLNEINEEIDVIKLLDKAFVNNKSKTTHNQYTKLNIIKHIPVKCKI